MLDTTFRDLLLHIIKELHAEHAGFGKTRLIKLAYLVEVEYYKVQQKRLTSIDWVFFKYGPYVMDYEDYIHDKLIEIRKEDDSDIAQISLKDIHALPSIAADVSRYVKRIVKRYATMSLEDLLDFVYYETEPMMSVLARGNELDFSAISEYHHYIVKNYKTSKTIKDQFEKRFKGTYGCIRPI